MIKGSLDIVILSIYRTGLNKNGSSYPDPGNCLIYKYNYSSSLLVAYPISSQCLPSLKFEINQPIVM